MSEKKFKDVEVEKVEDGNYAVISINRPDKLNALTTDTLREIYEAMEQFEVDSSVRCIVLRGTKNVTKKPAFSAGADLAAGMGKGLKPNIPSHMAIGMQQKHKYYTLIEQFIKPVIAAVDGFALGGGCELTLVCDIVIATRRSSFGFPEIARGIFPANGGTQRMARRVGVARALKMCLFGQPESAETMHNWGYVSFLCNEGEEFEKLIHEKASWLGNAATTSLYVIKKAVKFGTQIPIEIGNIFEMLGFGVNAGSKDVNEGIMAFLQKREPKFTGGM
ncbi:MAG: enoyl-CoA hydratase/isomerase family protein [Candidatus Lokiarchaeota archaeon]|nr:enoyl-CoA hydratase/isomerase family protein [Candidatus Lokiarchaeota archaeon]